MTKRLIAHAMTPGVSIEKLLVDPEPAGNDVARGAWLYVRNHHRHPKLITFSDSAHGPYSATVRGRRGRRKKKFPPVDMFFGPFKHPTTVTAPPGTQIAALRIPKGEEPHA